MNWDDHELDNMNELSAPAPIDNVDEDLASLHRHLEGHRSTSKASSRCSFRAHRSQSRTSSEPHDSTPQAFPDAADNELDDINELAAPAPICDSDWGVPSSYRHLEDARSSLRTSNRLGSTTHRSESRASFQSRRNREQRARHTACLYWFPRAGTWPHLITLSYLMTFSFLGTLTRLVLERLTLYPGAPVTTSVLWANVAGCLLMGFLSEDTQLFRNEELSPVVSRSDGNYESWKQEEAKRKKTVSLYVGLTTGYCGCLTSFASFIRDVFLAISNDINSPMSDLKVPNGGYSFMAASAILIETIGLSLAALYAGAHIAIFSTRLTPTIPLTLFEQFLDHIVVMFASLAWAIIIFLVIWLPHNPHENGIWSSETWRGDSLYALAFAPAGCLARFYLSLHLNSRIPSFPLGTFMANVWGTLILGIVFSLQHSVVPSTGPLIFNGGYVACQILQGVIDGFCGCMTTVSTWVLELSALRRSHSYIYGTTSVAVALSCLLVVMGSLRWTKGFDYGTCALSNAN